MLHKNKSDKKNCEIKLNKVRMMKLEKVRPFKKFIYLYIGEIYIR